MTAWLARAVPVRLMTSVRLPGRAALCERVSARRAFSRYTSEQSEIDTYIESVDFCPGTQVPREKALPSGARGDADRRQRMSTSHQVRVACVMQRNPITTRPLSDFEEAYHAFQISKQETLSRGFFDISSSNNGAGITASASLAGNRREWRAGSRGELPPPAEDSKCDVEGGESASLTRGGELAESDLRRRVERKLYFVILNELGHWVFPSYEVSPASKAALHTLASESLHRALGGSFELYPVGRSPVAFHEEALCNRTRPPFGTKTFFFRSQLIGGALTFAPSLAASQCAWLTKEEIHQRLQPTYYESVAPILSY